MFQGRYTKVKTIFGILLVVGLVLSGWLLKGAWDKSEDLRSKNASIVASAENRWVGESEASSANFVGEMAMLAQAGAGILVLFLTVYGGWKGLVHFVREAYRVELVKSQPKVRPVSPQVEARTLEFNQVDLQRRYAR